MKDLVNFVLKASGCNLEIDEHDIQDQDNVTGKLSDLQEEYQAVSLCTNSCYILFMVLTHAAKYHRISLDFENKDESTFPADPYRILPLSNSHYCGIRH